MDGRVGWLSVCGCVGGRVYPCGSSSGHEVSFVVIVAEPGKFASRGKMHTEPRARVGRALAQQPLFWINIV